MRFCENQVLKAFFIPKIMTLKEFLKENHIQATANQRSQIGFLISQIGDSKGYVLEDGWNVKDYYKDFLNSDRTIEIIINHLRKT